MNTKWTVNILVTALGLALFAIVNFQSGRLDANDGLGWDGRQYAHMVTDGLTSGTVPTQTRPLLPLLTRIPYRAGMDVIPAFQLMNLAYATALFVFLCLILDVHDVRPRYKAFFVGSVALCIATSKMFAYYPVQIDLGSLAVLTGATYVVLTQGGWAAAAAALLAVSAREFGLAVALFGFHRTLRKGGGLTAALLTFAPAVVAVFVIRYWAATANIGDPDSALLSAGGIVANLALWRDRVFVLFFTYFLLTVLGGVTLLLAVRPGWSIRRLVATPELATFAFVIVAAAAVGNADIWRYLVFLLPVVAILFAEHVNEHRPGWAFLAVALLLTLATQQPFSPMDQPHYFRDWFPVYQYLAGDATPEFWAAWKPRLAITVAGVLVLAALQWRQSRVNRILD